MREAGIQAAVDGGQLCAAGEVFGFELAIDATRSYFTANPGDIERSVDQLDLVQMRTKRNGDCVFDARRIVVPVVVVPGLIAVAVLCANGNIIPACIDLDASFVEPLFGAGAIDGIDLDFIPVPGGDVHRAVDIYSEEFVSAVVEWGPFCTGDWKDYLGYVPRYGWIGDNCHHGVREVCELKSGTRRSPLRRWGQLSSRVPCLFISFLLALLGAETTGAQTPDPEKPVPILSGSAGYFTNVTGGQAQLNPKTSPVLLLPIGDRWLIESRGEFEGDFRRTGGTGAYAGPVNKHLDYFELDYIANRYLTVTTGRFLTPFGIFNERLYPIWIRSLQPDPLIFPIATGSSDGAMLRGGFRLDAKANMNYAAYVSVTSIGLGGVESQRLAGGRVGFFLPGPRIEAGASWQKLLQDERSNAFGFHFAWQPVRLPLNLRSEYARSFQGSGYWIEGAYRLTQVSFWQKAMRHMEIAARAQQFFIGQISYNDAQQYGLPGVSTREGDLGLNYYLHDGLKVAASYGRQFSSDGNLNLWTVGLAYRFAFPLGRLGAQ